MAYVVLHALCAHGCESIIVAILLVAPFPWGVVFHCLRSFFLYATFLTDPFTACVFFQSSSQTLSLPA